MQDRVYDEVPHSQGMLVPVSVDDVCVDVLVTDEVVEFATFELHLLLVELVLVVISFHIIVGGHAGRLPLLLVVNLAHSVRDALAVIVIVAEAIAFPDFTIIIFVPLSLGAGIKFWSLVSYFLRALASIIKLFRILHISR